MYEEIHEIEFKGTIDINDSISVPLSVLLSYNKFDVTDLNIKLTLLSNEQTVNDYLTSQHNEEIIIKNDHLGDLVIFNIYSQSLKGNIITLKAGRIKYGKMTRNLQQKDKLHVQIKLTPAGIYNNLGLTTFNYNGSIKVSGTSHLSPYYLGKFGKYEIYTAYEYTSKEFVGRDRTIRTESTYVSISCDIEKSISFDEITSTINDELLLICSALQLATRSKVQSFESEYSLERNMSFTTLTQRTKLFENLELNSKPLMNIKDITGENFNILVSSIRDHKLAGPLKQSILYLTVSRNKSLESSFFYTFLSLDAIIDKILQSRGIATKVPSSIWKKIESSLRNHLSIEFQKDEELVNEIKLKLPELKRYSLEYKILKLIEILEVRTNDLWTTKPFSDGFSDAAKIRNALFHTGEIRSFDELYENGIRLKFLLERVILKVINWDLKNLSYFQHEELDNANWPNNLPYGVD